MSNIYKNDQITPELNREMNDLFIKELSKSIRPIAKDEIQKMSDEIENAEGSMAFFTGENSEMDALIRSQNRISKNVQTEVQDNEQYNEKSESPLSFLSREQLLENLNLVYGNLIELFKSVGLDDKNSESLIDSIQAIEKSINMVGGEVNQPFAPEDFVSGLESPDTGNDAEEKARRVIENTVKFYKAGKVSEIDIAMNEKEEKYIKVVFSGYCRTNNSDKKAYTATGYIGPISQFIGVEAIDYIYRSPNGGSMYVRSFEGGKWINKSGDFNIIFDEFNIESPKRAENSANEVLEADDAVDERETVITHDESHNEASNEAALSDEEEMADFPDFEIKEK